MSQDQQVQREPVPLEMELQGIEVAGSEDDYVKINLNTSRGVVACRYYDASQARAAIIWLGGAGGGFDSPAHGLYPRLAKELSPLGLVSLRIRFRHPTELDESVLDVLAGTAFLQIRRVERIGIVGHSFGGAVAIWAGTLSPLVKSVTTLATQTFGTGMVDQLAPRPLLLIHGSTDEVLPPSCSLRIYQRALQPKELRVLSDAGHSLDELADEVADIVRRWLLDKLLDTGAALPKAG